MSAIQCTGVLGRDAEARFRGDGTACLCIELHLEGHHLAIAAHQVFDSQACSAIVVKAMARRMRAGTRVTVRADSYDIPLRPTPHLVLRGVQGIETLALPMPQHHGDAEARPA